MKRKCIELDQVGGVFSISYFAIQGSTEFGADHGHRHEEIGSLDELSEHYRKYCERVTTMRHGPVMVTLPGERDDIGFINSLGHVYINQEQHKRIL